MKTYEELFAEFSEWLENDKNVAYLWKLTAEGKADYPLAEMYAKGISEKWAQLLTDAYGSDIAEEFEVADEIAQAYKKAYSETAYYTQAVQGNVNQRAKIGMKAIRPKLDEERINNLIDVIKSESATAEMKAHLLDKSALQPVTRSAISDTIEANARIQSKAGLHAYVERDPGAGCCKWCNSMAGVYEYGKQPKDFWRIHNDCTCTIEYKPSKYERASKIRYETTNGRVRKIIE